MTVKMTSSGGGHIIQDEGSNLTKEPKLNFVGSGVAVTDDGANSATVVTIAGTSPGGSDTQVQFNDSSAFGGDAGLVYDKTNDKLTVGESGKFGSMVIGDPAAMNFKINDGGATASSLAYDRTDRTSYITVTTDANMTGTPENLVNGASINNEYWGDGAAVAGKYIRFDFTVYTAKCTEAEWKGSVSSVGMWKWQGSNDASSWTDIGADFEWGTANPQTITTLSGNTTYYRYYQLLGVSGNFDNGGSWLWDMAFKQSILANPNPTIQTYITDGSTAGGNLKIQPNGGTVAFGNPSITGNATLEDTTSSTTGVIVKGTDRFIHNFHSSGETGLNTFVGIGAGNFTMDGSAAYEASYNTGVGAAVFEALTTGYYNTGVGTWALKGNTTGYYNNAFGTSSLRANVSGVHNCAFGVESLLKNTDSSNSAFGSNTLHENVSGNENTAIGYYAGYSNTGSGNTFVGKFANYDHTSGSQSTYVGWNTGRGITTGGKNTIIGANVTGLSSTLANTIILADGDGVKRLYIDSSGNIDLGAGSPTARLHLPAGTATASTAPIKLTSGVLLTSAEAGAVEFLTDAYYGTTTTGPTRKRFQFAQRNVTIQTTTYTVLATDDVVVGNSTSAFTITLPAATGSGITYAIKNINTGTVTVDGDSSDTIDGIASVNIIQWECVQVVDYAANKWIII